MRTFNDENADKYEAKSAQFNFFKYLTKYFKYLINHLL